MNRLLRVTSLFVWSLTSSVWASTCSIDNSQKVDCGHTGTQQADCEASGCCWVPAEQNSAVPWCFYPASNSGYALSNLKETTLGWEGTLSVIDPTTTYGNSITTLKLEVFMESNDYVRVKITDAVNKRWEVPQSVVARPVVTSKATNAKYSFTYTSNPFTFTITRKSDSVVLFQSSESLIFKDQYIQLSTSLDSSSKIFGLGESARTSHAHYSGAKLTLWARDEPSVVKNVNLYGSYPYYVELLNGKSHGVLLMNSNGMDIEYKSSSLTYKVIGGIIDLYIFSGSSPAEVSAQYTSVVGRPTMMPYWSLGFHNCRYGYSSVYEVEDIVDNYVAAKIPLDTQWMDIDYMQDYKDFTTDGSTFPMAEMTSFVNELHSKGMHFVPIVDPGIMVEKGYASYDEGIKSDVFIKDIQGNYYLGQVWPGPTYFPDFFHPSAQDYWTDQLQAFHEDVAIDGLWIDMNEIANFCNWDGKGQVCVNSASSGCPNPYGSQTDCCLVCSTVDYSNKYDFPPYAINNVGGAIGVKTVAPSAKHYGNVTVYDAHNLYGLTEQIATNAAMKSVRGKRPFVLTRSSFPSTGVHSAKWTGDNGAYWDDLKASIVGIMDLSLFGVPMAGADICGFLDNTNEELCARWIEVGAFYPFSRDHSAIGTNPQELYLWDSVATAARSALGMRYQLLPYLYTLFYQANSNGDLVTRPLWANFPSDSTTASIDRQFMLGSAILVSPVVDQGSVSVNAYFPKGLWYDFKTWSLAFDCSSSGSYKSISTPLTSTNVHVAGGNILPLQNSAMTTVAGRQTPFTVLVALGTDGAASGSLFWDDGEQIELESSLVVNYKAVSGSVSNEILESTYGDADTFTLDTIVVMGTSSLVKSVSSATLNGVALSSSQISYDSSKHSLTFSGLKLALSKEFELIWV